MNNKYLAALVCGFGGAVLTTIPGFQSIACCLMAPVASAIAVFLFKKSSPDTLKIKTGTGIYIGLLTAVFAALFASGFEIIITFITKNSDLVVSLPQAEQVVKDLNLGSAADESIEVLRQMVNEIQSTGFSVLYTFLITLTNLITYSIFGLLGGLIGTAIVNKRSGQIN